MECKCAYCQIGKDRDFVSFKVCIVMQTDSQDGGLMPRQTGSMVAHHDDVVTRMKNIELIEIGKWRIRPWYFSPYPQVSLLDCSVVWCFSYSLFFSTKI